MNLEEFIVATFKDKDFLVRPGIVCNDGFKMSVQGSTGHYCSPRYTQDWYDSMEIGFPSKKEPLIMEWAESPKKPRKTVYGWVPVDVIQEVINKHGGINVEKTFKNKL